MERIPSNLNKPSFLIKEVEPNLKKKFAYLEASQSQWKRRVEQKLVDNIPDKPTNEDFVDILEKELEVYGLLDYETVQGNISPGNSSAENLDKLRLVQKGLQNFDLLKEELGDEELLNYFISLDELQDELNQRANYITEKARGLGFVHRMSVEAIKRLKEIAGV